MGLYLCLGSSWHPDPLGVVPVGHRIGAGEPGRPQGMMRGHVTTALFARRRPAPILSTPPSNDALLSELPIAPGHPLFSATLSSQPPTGLPGLPSCAKPHHNHTLLAEAGPSPVPSGQFGSRQAPMAIVTSPTLFLSPPRYSPPASHPSAFACQGGDSGDPAPRCLPVLASLLSILLPRCLLPSLCPACGPRDSHAALHHVHCSLTAVICKTAFPPWILTVSLFSSLSVFLKFFSPHSPAAHPR